MPALLVSLLAHFLIAGVWHGAGSALHVAVVPLLQVRLERRAEPAVIAGAALDTLAAADPQGTPQSVGPARATQMMAAPLPAESRSDAGPAGRPDTRFYLARELDHYPVPLAPLNLRSQRHAAAGSVRLWVSINQNGRVVDVAVIEAEPPGLLEQPARDLVLATRFDPARKYGRPVKSRVLLALRWGS